MYKFSTFKTPKNQELNTNSLPPKLRSTLKKNDIANTTVDQNNAAGHNRSTLRIQNNLA
jgi:hypothetical protein